MQKETKTLREIETELLRQTMKEIRHKETRQSKRYILVYVTLLLYPGLGLAL